MSERIVKVNELILQQLGEVINRELELPNIFVTITRVSTSADLRYATVYVSVLPDEKAEYAIHRLNLSAKHLRAELLEKIVLRVVPRLEFRLDSSGRQASEIDELLDNLEIK